MVGVFFKDLQMSETREMRVFKVFPIVCKNIYLKFQEGSKKKK
jgi:hypothetical protein